MQPLDYLVIAPHPDDAELGAAGAVLSLRAQGASVGVLDLTDGEPTPHGSPEIRRRVRPQDADGCLVPQPGEQAAGDPPLCSLLYRPQCAGRF